MRVSDIIDRVDFAIGYVGRNGLRNVILTCQPRNSGEVIRQETSHDMRRNGKLERAGAFSVGHGEGRSSN